MQTELNDRGEVKRAVLQWRDVRWRHLPSAVRCWAMFAGAVALCFCIPLLDLARLAFGEELYSHIPLIPVVSAYLVWVKRERLAARFTCSRGPAAFAASVGGMLLAGYALAALRGWAPPAEDYLCVTMLSFYGFILAGAFWFLGMPFLRSVRFPFAFLIFIVPFPVAVTSALETASQYASAEAANLFLMMSGTPIYRDGLTFQLPGIVITVAQECSGIRSSFVLFITSLVAGAMFLETPWKRWVLALAVIPIGILRNGFRVFAIGMLCVHIGPDMIHSIIHRRGGPFFFVLALIPVFALLIWLARGERKRPGMLPEGSVPPGPAIRGKP